MSQSSTPVEIDAYFTLMTDTYSHRFRHFGGQMWNKQCDCTIVDAKQHRPNSTFITGFFFSQTSFTLYLCSCTNRVCVYWLVEVSIHRWASVERRLNAFVVVSCIRKRLMNTQYNYYNIVITHLLIVSFSTFCSDLFNTYHAIICRRRHESNLTCKNRLPDFSLPIIVSFETWK